MGRITVQREASVSAPAELTYRLLTDTEHHRKVLPDAFTDFEVLEGGVGAGTRFRVTLKAGGRTRRSTMRMEEPEPGRVLTESDEDSSLVTRFSVTPDGQACRVRIDTGWDGASGIGGFFERTFAPRVLGRIHDEELRLLDAYARSQATSA